MALPAAAFASGTSYALPDNYNFDKLGIDIGSLEYERRDTFLTIGNPGDGGLGWTFVGHYGADPYEGTMLYAVSPATPEPETLVKIGGQQTVFALCQPPYSACQNESGTGTTLVKTGANWYYTDRDGSVYKFDQTGDFSGTTQDNPTAYLGKLLSITRPSGAVITINYAAGPNFIIQSVVSSRGYALKYEGTPPQSGKISTVNLANHTCDATITTCDGVDASITFSGDANHVTHIIDPAGQDWQYDIEEIPVYNPATQYFNKDGIVYFKSPSGYHISVNYDAAFRISTVFDNRGSWTYRYPDETIFLAQHGSASHTISVTDPMGSLYYTAHASRGGAGPWTDYVQDPLGNKSQFGTDGGGDGYAHFIRLHAITAPEGNVRTWTHDVRGNVTAVTDTPKPGSGLSPISVTAAYPSSCTSPALCNKPSSETDANGHTTNYTYDTTHGGLLNAMGPAPVANGARPLKLVTWVQKTPYYKNPSGVLTASATPIWVKSTETECQTVAGANPSPVCDNAAPQTVITYEYGADGTANNLWPHGIAVSSGGTTLRTCYGYDALGDKISETKPNANLSVCP